MLEWVGILVPGKQNIRVLQQLHPDHVACTSGSSVYTSWHAGQIMPVRAFRSLTFSYQAGLQVIKLKPILHKIVSTGMSITLNTVIFFILCSLRLNH